MKINRYQFEMLAYIEKKGRDGIKEFSVRNLADDLMISGNMITESIKFAKENGLILAGGVSGDKEELVITDKGLECLEPYRVKRAVIFAAGFGSRMVPATLEIPKPLVTVNGTRIIDTLINALMAVDIKDITLVRGYKKEKFDDLLKDYPFIKLVDNDIYDKTNNISSSIMALDKIDECYICEADLMISNPDIIKKYQYSSNYLGSFALETDDWCFDMSEGCVANYRKGGKYCFNAYGISYWTKDDSARLRKDLKECYEKEDGKDIFWEFIPLNLKKDNYKVEIRQCSKSDIMEIDNFYELVQLDPSWSDFKPSEG